MQRFLTAVLNYLSDLGQTSMHAWRAFFFTPADPMPLGLIRILTGTLLFWSVVILGLDLKEYLGSEGWIGPEAVKQYLAEYFPWAWSFWLWVPDQWLVVVWVACLVVTALFTFGCWSRLTAVLSWMIAVSIVRRAPVTLFGFDLMLSTWLFYLAVLGASGHALSIDRLRSIRRTDYRSRSRDTSVAPMASVSANLAIRLIQLHITLIYASAGLSKLMGAEWWNGTALEMIMLTPEFRRFNLSWLLAFPSLLNLGTHLGLFLEIAYPVLIWVPKLRPLMITAIILMHLTIDIFLGLTEFGLAMITANLAFCSGPWLRAIFFAPAQIKGDPIVVERASRSRTRVAIRSSRSSTR